MADDRAYRVVTTFDAEHQRYIARAPELGIDGKGATRAEAIAAVEAEIEARIEETATSGEPLPRPVDLAEPGKLELDLMGPVYRELLYQADRQRVSPASLATQLLVRALAQLEGAAAERPRPAARPEPANQDQPPPRQQDNRPRGDHRRNTPPAGPNNNPNNRRREGYRPDLEDKANLMAYLRDQEKGGGGRGRR